MTINYFYYYHLLLDTVGGQDSGDTSEMKNQQSAKNSDQVTLDLEPSSTHQYPPLPVFLEDFGEKFDIVRGGGEGGGGQGGLQPM